MARAHLAPSLAGLFAEIDTRHPKRSKASDGWIGDAAHSARVSQHNPDENGIVRAIDVTSSGIDVKALIRAAVSDRRVWYVIHDGVIWSRTRGFVARRYTGANPHRAHVHISLLLTAGAASDAHAWFAAKADALPPRVRPKQKPTDRHAPNTRTLRFGDAGTDVTALRKALRMNPQADWFGPNTERAVQAYQRARGLTPDGVVGPKTWASILAGAKRT